MSTTSKHPYRRGWLRRGVVVLAALLLQGCSDVLKVTDPDIILDANSAQGALALRNGSFLRLSQAVNGIQGPDALFVFSGLMADEWRSGDTFVQRNNQDQRVFQPDNTFNAGPYRSLNRIRMESERGIAALRTYLPDSTAAVASLFAITAYSEVLMGELYCNGTPLSRVEGSNIVFGQPLTNDSVLRLAIANADSALAQAALAGAAGVRWTRLASIVKARALLDLGQYATAATTVAAVPTTYRFMAYHSVNSNNNQVWALNNSARRYTLTNGREGGVGIDFVTANDPRVPRQIGGAVVFDNSVPMTLVRQALYGQYDSIPVATGIEARLIQAEAQLQAGDSIGWLAALNTMRTDTTLYPRLGTGFAYGTTIPKGAALTALAMPPDRAAQVDVHFSERAFWMFSTGHRLGDMRRLLRQYGRAEAQVYPNGTFIKGGTYSDAVQMPVPFDEENNPNFTGCIDRLP
ncbi:MAG: hypothetical protein WD773_00665 [Gemmatimonadales bacterium]